MENENVNSAEAPKVLQVTSSSYFKSMREERNKSELIELPSGLVFELKRPDVVKLLREGQIPAEIAVSIQMATKDGGKQKLTGQQFKDYLEMVESVTIASCVNPIVKRGEIKNEDYDKGIISIDDVDMTDKEFIFAYADRGTKDLKSFRTEV